MGAFQNWGIWLSSEKCSDASTPEAKNPRATAAKPAGLRTSARQGLAMVAQWFHRWAEAEGVDGLPPN